MAEEGQPPFVRGRSGGPAQPLPDQAAGGNGEFDGHLAGFDNYRQACSGGWSHRMIGPPNLEVISTPGEIGDDETPIGLGLHLP